MKKHLFFVLFGLMAMSGWAQDRIILLRDTTRLGISVAELEKKYPPAFAMKAGQTGIFERHGNLFLDTVRVRQQQFFTYAERKKKQLPVVGITVETKEFIRPDGTYDRVFCEFSGKELSDDQEGKLLQFMAEWYGQHPFPIKTSTGFSWSGMTTLGSLPQKRTTRKRPGIISTIEAANQTTRPDTVKMLAFNQLDLSSVPEVVYRFPNLEELDLSKNNLHELPARLTAAIPTLTKLSVLYNIIPNDSIFFTRNKHLRSLNLQGNKLTKIPASVRANRRLESLWMGYNQLTALTNQSFRGLRRLNDLNLYSAGLTQLPKAASRMKRLKVLDLYYNKFTRLPPPVCRLKRLEQLAISHNDLSEFPASIAKMHRLRVLFAHHNRIGRLPDSFRQLQQLRTLDLSYNWFTVVPDLLSSLPTLEELDLNNNNLQEFPDVLLAMKNLKRVHVGSNPLFGREAMSSPYAPKIKQLEANKTQVTY
ncbi:leucine-rich repeat domain-containing protein [Spirosoma spitsbergense]|uniref:leucine-rich repeat domain-containing protein n=1 Tax=Spirosoma spitsbergense TaxID=431554 RepID=UPI0003634708|nr:leucine-rich repeat domain-containing protein [Spirosoma spitsbergense]